MPVIDITFNDNVTLSFKTTGTSISERWVTALQAAITTSGVDDRERFYGFAENEEQLAVERINKTIDTINKHKPIVERKLERLGDIDTLNYLHHIFEVNHGLLNQPPEDFKQMPIEYQKALAQLNIDVHRCESTGRGGNKPRFAVTYFGYPRSGVLTEEDLTLMTAKFEFGTVYLNYVEIGKTFEDLARDNDQYISDEAFKPFINFSADFNVKFWNTSDEKLVELESMLNSYYDKHGEFFMRYGYDRNHLHMKPGFIPVAKLETSLTDNEVVSLIRQNLYISNIYVR